MHFPEYYTHFPGKREPPGPYISLPFSPGSLRKMTPGGNIRPAPQAAALYLLWNVTPITDTLTQPTVSPLVFSTAPITASCTALATAGTTQP